MVSIVLAIYSIIVTVLLAITIRANNNGSSKARELTTELQRSREQVDSIRTELGKCREILTDNNEGLSSVIKRLREIAKEVEVLENIVNGGSTT